MFQTAVVQTKQAKLDFTKTAIVVDQKRPKVRIMPWGAKCINIPSKYGIFGTQLKGKAIVKIIESANLKSPSPWVNIATDSLEPCWFEVRNLENKDINDKEVDLNSIPERPGQYVKVVSDIKCQNKPDVSGKLGTPLSRNQIVKVYEDYANRTQNSYWVHVQTDPASECWVKRSAIIGLDLLALPGITPEPVSEKKNNNQTSPTRIPSFSSISIKETVGAKCRDIPPDGKIVTTIPYNQKIGTIRRMGSIEDGWVFVEYNASGGRCWIRLNLLALDDKTLPPLCRPEEFIPGCQY